MNKPPHSDQDRSEVIIDYLTGYCPVQAEGKIEGMPFYFRARGARWTLYIGTDTLSDHSWITGGPYGKDFEAGWMELDEARRFIARGAGLWLEGRSPEPSDEYAAFLEAELAWEGELRRQFGADASALRYSLESQGDEGSILRALSDKRDKAIAEWERIQELPRLRETAPQS